MRAGVLDAAGSTASLSGASQGDRALPVVRVTSDPRHGLALLEVIGPADSILHEPPPTVASETSEREGPA